MARRTTSFTPIARLAAGQQGAISRAQLDRAGISARRYRTKVARGELTVGAPNVLVVAGSVDSWRRRLAVATLALNGVPVGSHRSAARLHGLDGFDQVSHVEVTVPHGRRVRVDGAVVHQLSTWFDRRELVRVDGIRVTGLMRTLCDLGSVVSERELRRALDDYERRGRSLVALEREANRLHRSGQRGTKRLLAALDERRSGGRVADSWFERLVEECLQSPLIPGLVRQHRIRDERGRVVARCDLAVPIVRLGIEAHSRRFHTGPDRGAADNRRDWAASQQGWELKYVGWRDTEEPAVVRAEIEAIVARRAQDLGIDLDDVLRRLARSRRPSRRGAK